LSSRWVETIIAFSIALAALHNIVPIFKTREWLIAFGFGLFHGFGFASVLGEKGLSGDFMVLSLLGFNVGVELGQVLIICMIFPVLFLIRKTKLYPYIITYGSALLIFISLYWVIERGFEVDLPLGAYFWKVYNSIMA
ncbi:MAG: HupE/UreJ family protein, partial [Bacteroidota bacterium]